MTRESKMIDKLIEIDKQMKASGNILETAEFKDMKEYIETQDLNPDIVEEVIHTCEKKGLYVMNWDVLDDCSFIVIYNNYTFELFDLYCD